MPIRIHYRRGKTSLSTQNFFKQTDTTSGTNLSGPAVWTDIFTLSLTPSDTMAQGFTIQQLAIQADAASSSATQTVMRCLLNSLQQGSIINVGNGGAAEGNMETALFNIKINPQINNTILLQLRAGADGANYIWGNIDIQALVVQ